MNKHIIKQFIPHFFLGLVVFTFILIMDKIFSLTSLIINRGVSLGKVIMLFIYTLPSFLSLTFPMAFLMGTLLTYGTMQEDNEITALRAGGVSQHKILIPLISIALISSLGLIYFNQEIAPLTQKLFTKTYYSIAYQRPTLKLEENAFNEINEYKLFVKKINRKNNKLKDVIIYNLADPTAPMLITAKKGLIKQSDDLLIMDLFDGIMQKKDNTDPSRFNQIQFTKYAIKFDLGKDRSSSSDASKSIVNMTGKELKEEITRLTPQGINTSMLKVQYFQRISIALACLTFVLLAAPLSLITPKHNKAIAFGMSLIVIFIFYILLALGISLGERAILPASISLLLPNLILCPLGGFLIYKLGKV